jgi:hypothetical protein
LRDPLKFSQIGIFGLKIYHLVTQTYIHTYVDEEIPEEYRSAQTADAYTHRPFSEMLRGCSQTLIHLDK